MRRKIGLEDLARIEKWLKEGFDDMWIGQELGYSNADYKAGWRFRRGLAALGYQTSTATRKLERIK